MDGGDGHEIWLSFIQAKYLTDAVTYVGRCPTCRSPKDCLNHYCPLCKVGGLCPLAFRAGGDHYRHPWLQVRRQSLQSAVDPVELANFIGKQSADLIQTCKLNGKTLCYLGRTWILELNGSPPERASSSKGACSSKGAKRQRSSNQKKCLGCGYAMGNLQESNQHCLVCCLHCLVTLAQREPERNLLRLVDGALALTGLYPRTALEKTSRQGHSAHSGGEDRTWFAPLSSGLDIKDAQERSQADEGEPAEPAGGSGSRGAHGADDSPQVHGGGRDSASASADGSGGSGGAEPAAASGNQAPANSAFPAGYPRPPGPRDEYILQAISFFGDWQRYLGERGRD